MPCLVSASLEFCQFVCYGEKKTVSWHYKLESATVTTFEHFKSHNMGFPFGNKSLRISVQNNSNMNFRSLCPPH